MNKKYHLPRKFQQKECSAHRPADAAANLIARFEFTQVQTDAILDMRLHQLTGLAIEVLKAELEELLKRIEYLKALSASRDMRLGVIRDELLEIKEKYADPRRTEITTDDSDLNIADLIPRHSCVITVSNTGYIKRVPADTYRTQHRGGKGIIGMETKEEDHVEHLFNADSHDLIFFFTDRGFMYWLNVYEIPEGSRTGKGKAIVNMIKIEPGERFSVDFVVQNDGECQLKDLKWNFKAGSDDVTLTRQQQGSKNSIGKGSQMRGSNAGISSGGIKPSKASDVRFTLSADHVAGSTSTVIVTFTDGISEWEFPMSARF